MRTSVSNFSAGASSGVLLGARFLDGLGDPLLVEWFEQVIDSVHFKRLHRVLVEGGGENNFRQADFSYRAAS